MARPTLVDLSLDEYNQGSRYYSFMVNLDRYKGSCNTLENIFCRMCSKQTRRCKLRVFNMITRINESKTWTNVMRI